MTIFTPCRLRRSIRGHLVLRQPEALTTVCLGSDSDDNGNTACR